MYGLLVSAGIFRVLERQKFMEGTLFSLVSASHVIQGLTFSLLLPRQYTFLERTCMHLFIHSLILELFL